MSSTPWRRLLPGILLGVLALAVRLALWGSPPTASESLHYAVARQFGREEPLIQGLFHWYELKPFLLARPFFYAALWLPSQGGFDAARAVSLVVGLGLAPLTWQVLRKLDVGFWISFALGAVVALHSGFVATGARIEPIQWMAVASLGALLAQLHGRSTVSALLLAVAIGCDRLALVGGAGFLALAIARARAEGTFRAWPLRADAQVSSYLIVLALAPLPLIASARPTFGLFGPADLGSLVANAFLSPIVAFIVLAGLALPAARRWSALALAYPIVLLLSALAWDRSALPEQFVPSASLALVAFGVVAQEFVRRSTSVAGRRWAAVSAGVVALLLLVPSFVVVPHALNPDGVETLSALRSKAELRDSLHDAAAWGSGAPRLVVVDVEFESLYHPFHLAAPAAPLLFLYSGWPSNVSMWSQAIETENTTTILFGADAPLNKAVREVYADCVAREDRGWYLVDGAGCKGRGGRLVETFMRLEAAATDQ